MSRALRHLVSTHRNELRRPFFTSFHHPMTTAITTIQPQPQIANNKDIHITNKSTTHHFSTKTKLKTLADYTREKQEAKQRRTEQYANKQNRKLRLKTRRDPEKARYNRNQFHAFFDVLKDRQEFLDRQARRQGLDWHIRVSVMVERLPVIMPERQDWEKEYEELRLYLDRFRPVYPSELGFRDPKMHDIPTDEEVLGEFLNNFFVVISYCCVF